MMARSLLLGLLFISLVVAASAYLDVDVDMTTGALTVAVEGERWLTTGASAIHHDARWFTSAPGGGLRLLRANATRAPNETVTLHWETSGNDPLRFVTGVRRVDPSTVVLFQQFPDGLRPGALRPGVW